MEGAAVPRIVGGQSSKIVIFQLMNNQLAIFNSLPRIIESDQTPLINAVFARTCNGNQHATIMSACVALSQYL